MALPPRMNIVTALEFAQCSMYSIRSFVVPKDFSRTMPALKKFKQINVSYVCCQMDKRTKYENRKRTVCHPQQSKNFTTPRCSKLLTSTNAFSFKMSKTAKNISCKPLKRNKKQDYTFPNFSADNSWNLGTILPPVFTNRTLFCSKSK